MVSLAKFIWSSFCHISTSNNGASTSSSRSVPTTRSLMGPLRTEVPYNSETGIGLLAAMVKPASSHLRSANKPIRTGNHNIMTMSANLCYNSACNNVYCYGTLEASTSHVKRSCSLCSYRLDDARFYMYRGMMFCTRGCSFDYFMEALYHKRHMRIIGMPVGNTISAAVKETLVSAVEEERFRKVFFSILEGTKFP